ncbi:hypothetical protein [Deinococcus cavernae]|uniref:hypothetical protein n=1 Tax=Deinococcus cavernae TaxID=2320857 RepID=UPI001314E8D4|nr:hypothetical protein [Deinococcus cavernae]
MTPTTEPTLHQPQGYQELLTRLSRLSPTSPRQWGEMDVAQMLAHVTANLEVPAWKGR